MRGLGVVGVTDLLQLVDKVCSVGFDFIIGAVKSPLDNLVHDMEIAYLMGFQINGGPHRGESGTTHTSRRPRAWPFRPALPLWQSAQCRRIVALLVYCWPWLMLLQKGGGKEIGAR